jgi:hypothetical protein
VGAVVDFMRGTEAETAAGTVVEVRGDLVADGLGEMTEGSAFGQILADESVGVFVGAALPGVVRSGEVDRGAELMLNVLVAVELDAVVGSDGADLMRLLGEEGDHASVGVCDGGAGQWSDADQAALAFDEGDDAGLTAAVDSIAFPIAEARPTFDDRRSLCDHALAGEATAAVVTPIAFAALFAGPTQVAPERAAGGLVAPDPEVDRLVAHHRQTLEPAPPHDLRGTPASLQQRGDGREVERAIARVPPGTAAATVRLLDRKHRAVVAIVHTAVALDLPMNGRAMTAEGGRDLLDRLTLPSHRCDDVSFFGT